MWIIITNVINQWHGYPLSICLKITSDRFVKGERIGQQPCLYMGNIYVPTCFTIYNALKFKRDSLNSCFGYVWFNNKTFHIDKKVIFFVFVCTYTHIETRKFLRGFFFKVKVSSWHQVHSPFTNLKLRVSDIKYAEICCRFMIYMYTYFVNKES